MSSDLRELEASDCELVTLAVRVAEDQSDGIAHTVGAAVRDATGSVHSSINLHHFTGGPCAELPALASARADGARALTTIVAVGHQGRGVLAPCGRCRQVLLDHYPEDREDEEHTDQAQRDESDDDQDVSQAAPAAVADVRRRGIP